MIEMDFIELEDGLDYAIVDELIIDGIKYLYLFEETTNKIELRKLDSNEDLIKISNQKEIDKAMLEFAKIHRNDLA